MAVNQLVQVRVLILLWQLLLLCCSPATTTPAPTACTDLTAPNNGMIAYDTESMDARPVNTVATYICNPGYALTGDMTRTCQADGMWSGAAPTCDGEIHSL